MPRREFFFMSTRHNTIYGFAPSKKVGLDFKTKVVGLPLLCGKNIGQSGQRGLEVGFPDPIFELEIRKVLGTNHSILRYTKVDLNMKNKKK